MTQTTKLWCAQARAPINVSNTTPEQQQHRNSTYRVPSAAKALFDSSYDTISQVEDTHYSKDSGTLWAEPAVVPSYIFDESTADTPPTTSSTTSYSSARSLWAAPAEPPSPSLSEISQSTTEPMQQSTTELTQQPNLSASIINHPVLGHYRFNPDPNSPLNLPLLSPIKLTYDIPMNDTYIYNPPNNTMMNVPSELTPFHDTYIFHPNFNIS